MALLGSSIDPSLFVNDYSGFARAGAIQGESIANIGKQIGSTVQEIGKDYAAEQKKAKEIAANIKGSLTLLDNAKGIYKDLAPQIDSMKTKLIDPSISDEEKLVLSRQIEPLVNMYANYGMEGAKIRLMEAQIDEARAGKAPKTELTTVVNPETGQEIPVVVNFSTGKATPVTAGNMPATQPPVGTQATQQAGLGAPPMDIPIVGGGVIPANEGKLINNDTQVIYKEGIYDVDAGVLNSKDQAEEARGTAINQAANLPTTPQFVAPGSEKKKLELKKLALEIADLQSGNKTRDTELLRKKREADLEGVLRKNRTEKALEESGQAKTPKKLQEIETATSEYDSGAIQKAVNRLNAQGITYMGMPISTETIEGVLGTRESRAKEAQAVVEQSQAESQQELKAEQPMVQPSSQPQALSASQQDIFNAVKKANPNVPDEEIIKGLQSKPYFK